MANRRFIKSEACILIYGKNESYMVWDANNASQVKEAIEQYGKPNMVMKNFASVGEMRTAKKCYQWKLSNNPDSMYYDMKLEEPIPEEEDYFWQKRLLDEYFVNDIRQVVAKDIL